jgi:hypothetical protein
MVTIIEITLPGRIVNPNNFARNSAAEINSIKPSNSLGVAE